MDIISQIRILYEQLRNRGHRPKRVYLGENRIKELFKEMDSVCSYPDKDRIPKSGEIGNIVGLEIIKYCFDPDMIWIDPSNGDMFGKNVFGLH